MKRKKLWANVLLTGGVRDDHSGLTRVSSSTSMKVRLTLTQEMFKQSDCVLLYGNLLLDKLSIFQGSFRVKLLCVDSALHTDDLAERLKTPIEQLGDGKLMKWLGSSIADHAHSVGNVNHNLKEDLFSHALFAESKGLHPRQVIHEIKPFNIGPDGVFLEELMCQVPQVQRGGYVRCGCVSLQEDQSGPTFQPRFH